MTLTPRLALAARLCGGGRRLIDVGCDHAHLSAFLVAEGGFESALACDLRPGPLARARENLRAAGLEGRVRTFLTDGLCGIAPEAGDTVALCGMGGQLMAAILAAAPWTARGEHRLVLQPQSKAEALRAFLAQNGYTVEEEALAAEGERLYCVLRARGGQPPLGAAQGYLFTPRLLDDPLFPRYAEHLGCRFERRLSGLRRGGRDTREAERALEILVACRPSPGKAE